MCANLAESRFRGAADIELVLLIGQYAQRWHLPPAERSVV